MLRYFEAYRYSAARFITPISLLLKLCKESVNIVEHQQCEDVASDETSNTEYEWTE